MESSHTHTRIFIWLVIPIYNFSQTIIDVNSQHEFYDVLTLYYITNFTELHPLQSQENLQTTYSEHDLHLVPSGYGPFAQVLCKIYFPLHLPSTRAHRHNGTRVKLSNIQDVSPINSVQRLFHIRKF